MSDKGDNSSGSGGTGVPGSGVRPAAGDDARPGTPGTGENVCPECRGSGKVGGSSCQNCDGTGKVIEGMGGG